jgi:hypothetical protein
MFGKLLAILVGCFNLFIIFLVFWAVTKAPTNPSTGVFACSGIMLFMMNWQIAESLWKTRRSR